MNVRILPSAQNDLSDGFAFYEKQQSGLGAYFLDSLFSDIDSLKLHAVFTERFMVPTDYSDVSSPLPFIMKFTPGLPK